jgi:hypothetical protein
MRNFLNAFLNVDFSVLSLTRLRGSALKIFIDENVTPFWMHDKATYGLCNWSLCLVVVEVTDELTWKRSWLSTTNDIKE